MKTIVLTLIILLCFISVGVSGVSSYVLIDGKGLDTDVFISATMFDFKDYSINTILSFERVGVEVQFITPLLLRSISVNIALLENIDLMINEQYFVPGFGIGFSLRF